MTLRPALLSGCPPASPRSPLVALLTPPRLRPRTPRPARSRRSTRWRRLTRSRGLASWLLPLTMAGAGVVACSSSEESEVDVAAAPPPLVSGRYDVKGMTRTPGSQDGRRIEGTVILVQSGDTYTATYELRTIWPAEGSDTVADVIGVGEGAVADDRLEGRARTQLVISTVPGVDPGFAFVPRRVTARLESTSVARVSPDGEIEIELENRGATGEHYEPTRTRLLGRRVSGPGTESVGDLP